MARKLVWLREISNKVGTEIPSLSCSLGESSNTILLETAEASGTRLAMLVTHDSQVKFVFDQLWFLVWRLLEK